MRYPAAVLYWWLSSLRCDSISFPSAVSRCLSVHPLSKPSECCQEAEQDATQRSPPDQREPFGKGLQQAEQRTCTWLCPGVPQPLHGGSVSLPQFLTKQSQHSIKWLHWLRGARLCTEIDGASMSVCRLHGDTGPVMCMPTYISDGV